MNSMQDNSDNNVEMIAYIVSMGNGLESFVFREVDELYNKGIPVILFATKFKKGDIYSPKKEWSYYTYPAFCILLEFPWVFLKMLFKPGLLVDAVKNNAVIDLVFAMKFSSIMKRKGIKQIHCHFGDHKLFIGNYCKRLTGLPLSVTIHSHELHVNPNEKMFKNAILNCDRVFAISQLAVDILKQRYSVPAERVVLNKLSLDSDLWSQKKPFRVVTVARFQPQKGLEYLFAAAQILCNENIEFLVIGFGPLDVRKMALDMGVNDKILFFEKMNQAQLRLIYQSCDVYCLPSITHPEQGKEGIPVVLMEAMACGMPVIATDAGAVKELVEEVLVSEKSGEEIANAIRTFMNNPELRSQHTERNIAIVREKHGIENAEKFAIKLLELSK